MELLPISSDVRGGGGSSRLDHAETGWLVFPDQVFCQIDARRDDREERQRLELGGDRAVNRVAGHEHEIAGVDMAGFVADAELGFAFDHDQQLFVIGLAMPNLYARQGSRDEPGKTEASHTPARLWQWLEAAIAGINHKFICNFQPKSVGLNALQVAKFGEDLYRIRSASALVFAEVCGVARASDQV